MNGDESTADLFAQIGRAVTRAVERFDGATYDPEKDGVRLGDQLKAVRAVMEDGAWHTLRELAATVGASEASVSARVRDLRKSRFGSHTIERRRVDVSPGLFEYRMVTPP